MPHTPPEFFNPIFELLFPIMKNGYFPITPLGLIGINQLTAAIIGLIIISELILFNYYIISKLEKQKAEKIKINSNNLENNFKISSIQRNIGICVFSAILLLFIFTKSPKSIAHNNNISYIQVLTYHYYAWSPQYANILK
jgi:hypothetical protein